MATVRHSDVVPLQGAELAQAALTLASIAGGVANFCDHAEHNEPVDLAWITTGGERMRLLGVIVAAKAERGPIDLYRQRLRSIERRNVLHHPSSFDGAAAVPADATWRGLQLTQCEHDRVYHPDVLGLAKVDQLRHYALHVAKLAGAAADASAAPPLVPDFVARRVPDMLIFGVKLSTVVGERLSDRVVAGLHADIPPQLTTSLDARA